MGWKFVLPSLIVHSSGDLFSGLYTASGESKSLPHPRIQKFKSERLKGYLANFTHHKSIKKSLFCTNLIFSMKAECWLSSHTSPAHLLMRSEPIIDEDPDVLTNHRRGSHFSPSSSDWHERRKLGPNFADKPKWTQLRLGSALTERSTSLFSKLDFTPTWAWANICHWLQKYSKLSTSQNHQKQSHVKIKHFLLLTPSLKIWL